MRERHHRQSRTSGRSLNRATPTPLEAFLALEGALAGTSDKARLFALGAAISEFNFDGAWMKLDEIAKEFGTNPEQSK